MRALQADEVLKQQQGGMLGGWLGRVTGSFSESDEEGTARRGGTTSAPGASPRGWGSGMVTALSGSGRSAAFLISHRCAGWRLLLAVSCSSCCATMVSVPCALLWGCRWLRASVSRRLYAVLCHTLCPCGQ